MGCKAAPPAPPWSLGLQSALDVDMVCLGVEQLGCSSDLCSLSFCLAAPAEQQLPLHTSSPGSLLALGDALRSSSMAWWSLFPSIEPCGVPRVRAAPQGPVEKGIT